MSDPSRGIYLLHDRIGEKVAEIKRLEVENLANLKIRAELAAGVVAANELTAERGSRIEEPEAVLRQLREWSVERQVTRCIDAALKHTRRTE